MKSTSIKDTRPSDDETFQQTRQSKPTNGTEKLSTSRSSRLIDKESSTTVKNPATTTNTDSIRSKHMPKTGTHHSNQQSVTMTNGDHETTVLHSKSVLSSTGRWTSEKVVASTTAASAQKTTGFKSTKKATRSDLSRSHTSAASTKKIFDSNSSRIHTTGNTISSDPPSKSTGSDPRKTRTSAVSTKKTTSSDSSKIPLGTISTLKTVSSDFIRSSTVGETTHSDPSRTHTAAGPPMETTIAHSRGSQTTVASSWMTTGEDLNGGHSSEISVVESTTLVFTTQKTSSQTSRHSSITATEGQSASLPHPTTATTTTTTNSVIETIITGSMGTVVTYVATRDPKYTTNTRTTTATDDRGDDVIIYPGALNPDPEDHDHDHDRDQSKSTTESEDCTTTKPPSCTKTVSYISSGTGFTSTILGTCPPVSGCISGEQSTTTTTIATSRPYIWIKYPLEPDFADPLEEIDDDTIQYFNDLFDKQDISLEDDENLVASCGGNTPGIPVFCLNSFSTDFCQEVHADLGLTGIHPRRLLTKRNLCSDWSFEFRWSGALFECRKSCLDYLDIVRNECFQFKSNDEGFLDAGCGTYNLVIKPILSTSTSTSTTESPPEPTEIPKTPLELKPVMCEDEANFPGHGDVHKGDQKRQAESFCETYFLEGQHDLYMGPQNTTVWATTGFIETNLYFSVSWIDGCETTVDSQNAMLPLGNDMACSDILVKTYRDCINGGVGGYIDAGCLRYQFNPAK
ncbi:hypothetical protein TrVFT333_009078 [Trichoderma virens FT-333]|nr:hypothetical protein TrVFT333_009078 [Trichoderma virens FT-333]